MPRSVFTIVLMALAIPPFSNAETISLLGLEIPPLPAGCTHQESSVLGASDAFAYERLLCNGREVVVLQRFVERRGKLAYWKIIDELYLPAVAHGQAPLEVPLCSSTFHKDEAILAISKWTKAQDGSFVAKDISHAWSFNLISKRIESISTRGVSCEGDNPD